MSRKAGLLATAAVVSGVVLAGCASGPGQAGSAAIVGGTSISVDSVQQELNSELANAPAPADGSQPAAPADQARQIVSYAVMDKVVNAAVAKYHLSASDQDVSKYLDANGELDQIVKSSGLSSAEVQEIGRQAVALLDYAHKYLLKMRLNIDYTFAANQKTAVAAANKLAANPADAKSILQSVAGPSGQITLGQQLNGGQLIAQQVSFDQQAQSGGSSTGASGGTVLPLFGAQAGTALAFPFTQGQWMVALVHSVDTNGTVSSSDASALRQVPDQDLVTGAREMLNPLAQQLGIRISPRYGVWDPISMQVVASTDKAAGVEVPVHRTNAD